jgi:hypothetical protein
MCMDTTIRVGVTFLAMALAGCASYGNLVRCDGRLEPINAPMPREMPIAKSADRQDSEAMRFDRE